MPKQANAMDGAMDGEVMLRSSSIAAARKALMSRSHQRLENLLAQVASTATAPVNEADLMLDKLASQEQHALWKEILIKKGEKEVARISKRSVSRTKGMGLRSFFGQSRNPCPALRHDTQRAKWQPSTPPVLGQRMHCLHRRVSPTKMGHPDHPPAIPNALNNLPLTDPDFKDSLPEIVLALAPGGAEVGTLFTPGRPSQVFPSQSSAKDELAPTSDIQVGAHQPDGGVANGALNPVKGSKRSGDAPQLPLKADKGHAGTGGAGLGRGGRKGAVWIYGNSEEVRKARIGGFGPLQVLLKNFRLPPPPPSRGCEYLSVLKTPRHVKNRLPLLSPRSIPRADDGRKGRDGKNEGEAAKDQAGLKCLVLDWEHKVFERKVCDEGAGRSGQDGLGIASPRLTPTALTSSLLAHNNFATCAADKEDVAPWGTRLDVDDDRGHLSYESTLDMLEAFRRRGKDQHLTMLGLLNRTESSPFTSATSLLVPRQRLDIPQPGPEAYLTHPPTHCSRLGMRTHQTTNTVGERRVPSVYTRASTSKTDRQPASEPHLQVSLIRDCIKLGSLPRVTESSLSHIE